MNQFKQIAPGSESGSAPTPAPESKSALMIDSGTAGMQVRVTQSSTAVNESNLKHNCGLGSTDEHPADCSLKAVRRAYPGFYPASKLSSVSNRSHCSVVWPH